MNRIYFGIDYGRERVGVSISDAGVFARPFCTIKNKGNKKVLASIDDLVLKHCGSFGGVTPYFVVGVPYLRDGQESEMAREVRRFGEELGRHIKDEVIFHDEYLSSVDAANYIRDVLRITDREKAKQILDAVAASMILQSYLDVLNAR